MEASIPERAWLPREGEMVAGRYRVRRLLGAGGMGAVVEAEHVALGELVAVKFMTPKLTAQPEQIARFVREARVTARLKNEHVVRVLDVGATEAGLPFMAMELLAGEDLARVSARGVLPLQFAVDVVLQAIAGLLCAHEAGVVHRDVKPSNLWLTQRMDGSPLVKVLDFGISKLVDAEEQNKRLTETQSTFGSPSYMSPEQVRSAKRVDSRTDAWAIGVVLFELLTQKLPFDAENASGVLAAVVADEPVLLREYLPSAPPELEGVILGLLRKQPQERLTLVDAARLLRPFATPGGQSTADGVARLYAALASSSAPAVAPGGHTTGGQAALAVSQSSSSASGAFDKTIASDSTASQAPVGARRTSALVAAVVGLFVLVGVIGLALGPRLRSAPAPDSSRGHAASSDELTAAHATPPPRSSAPPAGDTALSRVPPSAAPASPEAPASALKSSTARPSGRVPSSPHSAARPDASLGAATATSSAAPAKPAVTSDTRE